MNSKFPLKDTQGEITGIYSLTSDITDMKEAEARLSLVQKMEAVGTFADGIAHDFNNLLTGINLYSQSVVEDLKPDDPLHHGLSEITKASDRAATLMQQLLAVSRKQILQPKVIDLGENVTEMGKMLRRIIGEKIGLNVRRDPDLRMVKADPAQIDHVIMNLCVNARDAMPHGGNITIGVENVSVDAQASTAPSDLPTGNYVMLSISDTGVGMGKETLSHIFEPFYTTMGAEDGAELGLSTVFGIVAQNGGVIEAESEPGKGSTFRIYLAQVETPEPVVDEKEQRASAFKGCETIMVVEDDEMNRELLERILEPIDLMITDVIMPQMGGHELAKQLAPLRPEMSVLYISGYDEEMVADQGPVGLERQFFQKSFFKKDIAKKIREILDRPASTP